MCGIAGEFLFDPAMQIDPSRIPATVSAIRHRGPDEWGYYIGCGGSALLINTRLSIVDVSNGRQPLPNEDGSIWVVLNGEIYGFSALAAELAQRGTGFEPVPTPKSSCIFMRSMVRILSLISVVNSP